MKNLYKYILLIVICLQGITFHANAQCTNTSSYGSATAPSTYTTVSISTCTYQSEYNTINSVVAGNTYQSTYSLGGCITVHSGTYNGPVVASGTTPLTWTATVSGTYYISYNTSCACGTATSCGTSTIALVNTSSCTDGIQNGAETGVDCGGTCTPCHCSDGIQNNGEDGIDCGAVCGTPCPCQVTVTGNPGLNLPCGGGTVTLTADGQGSSTYALNNNFDAGSAGPGWNVSPAGQFNNPCGTSIDGGTYMWMGSTTAAPRTLQTAPLDVSCGGDVCFYLKFSVQGGASPCEGPDLTTEGVYFQYSTNGGATWTTLNYFQPNASGAAGTITNWNQYCFTIPAAGVTSSTIFQWYQSGSSGTCCDHWGIDNVEISTQNCSGFYYNWDHLAPIVDDSNQVVTVSTTTTYTVWYTNGVDDSCYTDVTITVGSLNPLVVNGTAETCSGDNDGTITVSPATGGTPNYTYQVSGPVTVTQVSNGSFTNLPPGTYNITVTDAAGCQSFSSFTVNAGPLCCPMTNTQASTNVTCNGASNGTITLTETNGAPTVTFSIDGGATSQTSGSFTGLGPGTYSILITDGNNCTYTSSITITQPAALVLNATPVNATCGLSNGSITLSGSGGSGSGYQYSINNGATFQASGSFTGLAAGNYDVVLQDGSGCTISQVVTVNNSGAPTINSITPTNPSCNGVCDGSVVVVASGGSGALQYSNDNGATFQASGTFTGLCNGNYNIVIEDALGCPAIGSATLTAPAAMAYTATTTDLLCNSVCGGAIAISGVTGGNGTYQYSIDNGATFQAGTSFTGLCAGTYNVVVEDGNGCSAFSTETIIEPPVLTVTTTVTDPTCNGSCDGIIVLTEGGGTPTYQYSIDNGVTFVASGTFNSLCAGTYNVAIEDGNGCKVFGTATLTDPVVVSYTFTTVDPTCGAANGEITLTGAGGTGALQYSIDNGATFQGTGIFTGLMAGTYNVIVQDANLCQATGTITISNLSAPIIDLVSTTDPLCPAACDGTITITASGGSGALQYSIDNGVTFQASGNFTGVCAGSYSLQVMDANSCVVNSSATLTDPATITFSSNAVDLICYQVCAGEIDFTGASGGAGSYQYSIDNGVTFQAATLFTGLCAGSYNLVVEDANGCQVTGVQNVSEPTQVTISYTAVDNTCNQANAACDGSITITGAGGTGAYQYSMDNGVTYQAGTTFTGICAGTYDIVVSDANGCQAAMTATVNEPIVLNFTFTTTLATCGMSNGSMTLTGAGGTGIYEYSMDGGTTYQASGLFSGLAAGAYNSCVRDANGCVFCQIVNVNNDPAQTIDNIVIVDNTCFGSCDGSVTVTTSGGTGTIEYSLDGGPYQASNVFTGVCAGTHNIMTQDDNACLVGAPAIVNEPAIVAFTPAVTNLLCYQQCIGTITFNGVTGGNGVYQYSIDNGVTFQASNSFTGLCAGVYDLVVSDGNNCTAAQQVTITEPTLLTLSTATTDAICNTYCNGTATATVTGGVSPYNYAWTASLGIPTNQSFANGLCAGAYDLIVTDANGCVVNDLGWVINEPAPFVISTITPTDELCSGSCDGTIAIVAPGAVEFSINNGGTFTPSGSFTGLCSGTYSIIVQDAAGCQATGSATISTPNPLTLTPGSDTTICIGGTANITATAGGGTAPYTYNWDIPATGQTQSVSPAAQTTYAVTVTDDNGCISPTRYITVDLYPALQVFAFQDASICPGDSSQIEASAMGGIGGPYTYTWTNNQNATTLAGELHQVSPTTTTVYTVTVTDGCESPAATASVTITVFPLPVLDFTSDVTSGCVPVTVVFENLTSNSSLCTWDFGDGTPGVTGDCNPTHIFTLPGCYDVNLKIETSDGCIIESTVDDMICVSAPPVADFSFGPQPTTVVDTEIDFTNLSTGAVDYEWNFGDGSTISTDVNPTHTYPNSGPGTYQACLLATTSAGCSDSICQFVIIDDQFLLYVPNAFSPNADGKNDVFMPVINGFEMTSFKMYIFDRWGEVIFETTFPEEGWDGTYKGFAPKQDVYIWRIEVTDATSNEKKQFHGHVTVLPDQE